MFKFLLSILVILVGTVVFALPPPPDQIPFLPPPPELEIVVELSDYDKAYIKATELNQALLIFINCKITTKTYIAVRLDTLNNNSEPRILVHYPSLGNDSNKVYPPNTMFAEGMVSQSADPFSIEFQRSVIEQPIVEDNLLNGSLPLWPDILKNMKIYQSTPFTQRIYNLGEETDKVSRYVTEKKWHQSGGMMDISDYTSTLYKFIPDKVNNYIGIISVANGIPSNPFQNEVGLLREYPNGTKFIDRLKNKDGKDFEVRLRFKEQNNWKSKIIFSDIAERPNGYLGLKQSCASCHDEAGTGIYGVGLVPGGDTIISDELPWYLLNQVSKQERIRIRNGLR